MWQVLERKDELARELPPEGQKMFALIERLFPSSSCREAHGGYQVFEVKPAEDAGSRAAPIQLGAVFAALDQAGREAGTRLAGISS